jgi:hypothetical protein
MFRAGPARREHTVGRNTFRAILFLLSLSASGALLAQSAPQNNPQDSQNQGTSDKGNSDQGAGDQDSGDQNAANAAAPAAPAPTPTRKAFVVNGKTVNAEVLVVDGRSYVDIDSLAQIATITNGSMTVEPTRITLTIPVEGAAAPAAAAANAPPDNGPPPSLPGFSKPFVANAIGALAEMREWRGATQTMITYGLAVSEAWAQGYQSRAMDDLTQATLAATSDDDHSALALLQNEFNNLANWSGQTLSAREALNGAPTIDPNTLANDQTLAKINACGGFLSGMLLSGTFSDNASCH